MSEGWTRGTAVTRCSYFSMLQHFYCQCEYPALRMDTQAEGNLLFSSYLARAYRAWIVSSSWAPIIRCWSRYKDPRIDPSADCNRPNHNLEVIWNTLSSWPVKVKGALQPKNIINSPLVNQDQTPLEKLVGH